MKKIKIKIDFLYNKKNKYPKPKNEFKRTGQIMSSFPKNPRGKMTNRRLIRNPRGPPTSGIKEQNFKKRNSVPKKSQTNTNTLLEEKIKYMTSKMDDICNHLEMFLSKTDNKQLTKERKIKFYEDYPTDANFLQLNGFNIYIFISLYPKLFSFDNLSNNMTLIYEEEKHLFIYCYKCLELIDNTKNKNITNKTPNYCIWCSK